MKIDERPLVLEQSVNHRSAELRLQIPRDNDCFRDHFSSAPIVPGILQLHWAIEYARSLLEIDTDILAIEVLKFQHAITPDSTVTLKIEIAEDASRFYFDYSAEGTRFSSGRIILG
jgi:3-hydroxymyristoyl/3-hydroxydecanoyl-(acyl carrier protein) dehydratase